MRIMAAALFALLITACTQEEPVTQRADTVIFGVHVIDPADGSIARDRTIVISDGMISAIGQNGEYRFADTAQRIDGQGAYVTPGLWDAHVHVSRNVEDALDRVLPAFIAYGVTHVRDMGSNPDRLRAIRDAVMSGPALAPAILAGGPILVERELQWYGDLQRAIGEPAELEAAIAEAQANSHDFFKAYSGLSADSYAALVAAAEDIGLPVDGHVPQSVGVQGVISAGQRTIEHLDLSAFNTCWGGERGPFSNYIAIRFGQGLGAYINYATEFWSGLDWAECAQELDRFAARGGAVTPTLVMEVRDRSRVPEYVRVQLPGPSRAWCEEGLEEFDAVGADVREAYYSALFGAVRSLHARAVTLLAGTDTPNHCIAPASSLALELELLAEAGLPLLSVLQSTAYWPYQVFGVSGGQVSVGQPANLVLFASNPLDDVAAYRAPVGVFTQGRWIGPEGLEAIREGLVWQGED